MLRAMCLMSPVVALLILGGCGSSGQFPDPSRGGSDAAFEESAEKLRLGDGGNLSRNEDEIPASADTAVAQNQVIRRIIYNANLSLVVESFDSVPDSVSKLVVRFDGFISDSLISGTTGTRRHGDWTVRVPSNRYRDFLAAAGSLGEVTSTSETAREVTAEYYDLEARIRNKQKEEARLIVLLEENTGKLDDILNVEREISRVRGEIEQLQGRMRVLSDLTSFSTIRLEIQEVQDYVPEEAATFGTRIKRTWNTTLDNLKDAGEMVVLTAVSTGPWLLVLGVPAGLFWRFLRWRFRAARRRRTER